MSEYRKKLIEVALPLDEINAACKADKDRKTGTLRNIHKWFAPMPLPAWRALLYAALIDDPKDDERRAYHLDLIKRLVANGANPPDESVVAEAQANIVAQHPDGLPPVIDPFCGGGSTLVEAQRLGLPVSGSDLNPVPVLITRTLTELLPPVAYRAAITEADGDGGALFDSNSNRRSPFGGIAKDLRVFGERIRQEAIRVMKDSYPVLTGESPVAWVWARSARCPNPACQIATILTTSWWLSKRPGDLAWIEPSVVDGEVRLAVTSARDEGTAPSPTKIGEGSFACLACQAVLDPAYLRGQGEMGALGMVLMAVVTQAGGKRKYRSATDHDREGLSRLPKIDESKIDVPLDPRGQGIRVGGYGMRSWKDLFAPRQRAALLVLADLVAESKEWAIKAGADESYATTIATLLGLVLGKAAHANSTQAYWKFDSRSGTAKVESAFGRNDLPMTWDFAESAILGTGARGWSQCVDTLVDALPLVVPNATAAEVRLGDARTVEQPTPGLIATDPPYFDAIGYADLSDYFYIWHRVALRNIQTDLYRTVATPKAGELTAIPSRQGGAVEAQRYFVEGFTEAFGNLQASSEADLPMLVVYASKETKSGKGEETRWSSILTAMVDAGLQLTGTWPIHGTGSTRMRSQGSSAVATYVAMVARPRPVTAESCSLQDFNRALRRELKPAVHNLQAAGILPVDLAQAALGPGMQVYSRYRSVLDQSGRRVPVEQALRLINQALGEVLDEQEGELDPDSRFAVTWWEKHHWAEASFGEADQLARPHGISVDDLVRAGVAAYARPGHVIVIGNRDLDRTWLPSQDSRPTAWEAVHHLADRLVDGGGVAEAGSLMGQLGVLRDQAQGLVYRLHAIAARKGWTKDQERYNALIGSWSDLLAESGRSHGETDGLF